jgi:septum formation protein
MTRVVLGSASQGRRKVLRQAGIEPLVVESGLDEDRVIAALPGDASPTRVTTALASAKADAVVNRLPAAIAADCVVIGCDSLLYFDGELRGKPSSADVAIRRWQSMAGRTGELYTGHCVIRLQHNEITHRDSEVVATSVQFGTPSAGDLHAYVESGEPLTVAGAFTLDGLSGWFIEGVEGDPSAVIGIGLPTTRRLFERAGLSLTELWQANRVG